MAGHERKQGCSQAGEAGRRLVRSEKLGVLAKQGHWSPPSGSTSVVRRWGVLSKEVTWSDLHFKKTLNRKKEGMD